MQKNISYNLKELEKVLNESDLSIFNKYEQKKIIKARDLATKLHDGQRRDSGQDYIIHPTAVAKILILWGYDAEVVIAGLLHDTIEDCNLDPLELRKKFGEGVLRLVQGVTKITNLDSKTKLQNGAINIQKFIIASSRDLRIIALKCADRLHNLLTIQHKPREDQVSKATSTLEILYPLAKIIALGEAAKILADTSFGILEPDKFKEINDQIKKANHKLNVDELTKRITKLLKDGGMTNFMINGRVKGVYSAYRKIQQKIYENDVNKLNDLLALRVIIKDSKHAKIDCYRALGLIHQEYISKLGSIKDFISLPKTSGYQALHSILISKSGQTFEVQIKTENMHKFAEFGPAAHVNYDLAKNTSNYIDRKQYDGNAPAWVQSLSEVANKLQSGDYSESDQLIIDELFKDRIFCFTPSGEVIDLPENATILDFAYQIHGELGHFTDYAIVENERVEVDTILRNRLSVRIIKSKKIMVREDWLSVVKTDRARKSIKQKLGL